MSGAAGARASLLGNFLAWRHAWLVLYLAAVSLPVIFVGDSYIMGTFVTIACFSVVVVSLDLVMGYGGLPNFGVNGFFAVGAFLMGVLGAKFGVPLLVGALLAVALNLALAFLIGVATLRMRHYYFAVASFGFGIIVVQVLGGLPDFTGGWSGLTGIPKLTIGGYTLSRDLDFYVIACALLLAVLAIGRNVVVSGFGRAVRAIAVDDIAAETLGVHVAAHKVKLFMFTSVFCSLAGSVYVLYLRVPTPANFDVPVLLEMTLMLFLGGQRTLWGAVVGALLMGFLPEVMGGLNDYTTAFQGLTLMLILLFLPNGLAGTALAWSRRRFAPAAGQAAGVPSQASAASAESGESAESAAPAVALTEARPTSASGMLLEVRGLSRHFGGVMAVSELDFTLRPGRIKAIIGPNGAGKTTTFNLLTRALAADAGEVLFRGVSLKEYRTHEVAGLGMVRTFQTPRLFGNMTVLDNVKVGCHLSLRAGILAGAVPVSASTRAEEAQAERTALGLLRLVGLDARAGVLADELPFGERRLLEIARALAVRPSLLLLDEPAAGLNESEKDRLAELLLDLRERGVTLLLVEHDMRLVMRLADENVVMNYGRKIAEGTPAEIQRNDEVLSAYLGEEIHATRNEAHAGS